MLIRVSNFVTLAALPAESLRRHSNIRRRRLKSSAVRSCLIRRLMSTSPNWMTTERTYLASLHRSSAARLAPLRGRLRTFGFPLGPKAARAVNAHFEPAAPRAREVSFEAGGGRACAGHSYRL